MVKLCPRKALRNDTGAWTVCPHPGVCHRALPVRSAHVRCLARRPSAHGGGTVCCDVAGHADCHSVRRPDLVLHRVDFSVQNVVENSHSLKPMLYKISGVWGNHEGSMLLWVLILALFSALVALFGGNLPDTLKANVLAVRWITVASCCSSCSPPTRSTGLIQRPMEGNDLNPILQDPARDPSAACSISAMSGSRWRSPLPSPR
jgi:hypothetical protein